jgi:hypothetical protein
LEHERRGSFSAPIFILVFGGLCLFAGMIQPEELVGGGWAEWCRLTPAQRWLESVKLWQICFALGGSLDPKPDEWVCRLDTLIA